MVKALEAERARLIANPNYPYAGGLVRSRQAGHTQAARMREAHL